MSYFTGAYKKRKGNHTFLSQDSVSTYTSSVADHSDESVVKHFKYVLRCPKILSEKPTKLTQLLNQNLKYSYLYETTSTTAAGSIVNTAAGTSSYVIPFPPFGSVAYQDAHDLFMNSSPNTASAIYDTSLRSCFLKGCSITKQYFNAGNTTGCFELSEVVSLNTTDLVLATELVNVNAQYAYADQGYNQGTYAAALDTPLFPRIVGGSPQYFINHNPAWKRHFRTLSTKRFMIGPGQSFKISAQYPFNQNVSSNDLSDAFTAYKGHSFLVLRMIGQMTLGGVVGADAIPVYSALAFSSFNKYCYVGTIINHAITNNPVSQFGEKAVAVTSGVGHHFDEDGDTILGTGENLNAVDNDPII